MVRLLFVFGTRPEAIKLCPVIMHLKAAGAPFDVRVCVTAQHREMLDQVLQVFGVIPDLDLGLMAPGQSLCDLSARVLQSMQSVLPAESPDMILVQGDTTTTMCAALAAFYHRIPVAHVEAGLRTGNMSHPFPEELNRVITGKLAAVHFAATEDAATNLEREAVERSRIHVTGNTGIDALLHVARQAAPIEEESPERKLVLVTAHRRESFGQGLQSICRAIATLAERPDVHVLFPVHPNPNVRDAVDRLLKGRPNVSLVQPLDYVSFVSAMSRAHLILTDSGGVQEEAPSLGKPILVLRETTERPEGVAAGAAVLVGTDENRIVLEAERLLDDAHAYREMAQVRNIFGDGHATERIRTALLSFFNRDTANAEPLPAVH